MKFASFAIDNATSWGLVESDVVEVEIDKVGLLRNGIADEV
jgi:hypothetical protein